MVNGEGFHHKNSQTLNENKDVHISYMCNQLLIVNVQLLVKENVEIVPPLNLKGNG